MKTEAAVAHSGGQRSRLQFSLFWLLLLMVPLGIAFLGVRRYMQTRPIVWEEFSQGELDRQLDAGRIVVVNVHADWNFTTSRALETPSVRRAFRLRGVVPMRADGTIQRRQIGGLRDDETDVYSLAAPTVVVFDGRNSDPTVLRGNITEEGVLKALEAQ